MKKWIRIGQCIRCGDCCRPETMPARIEAYKKAGIVEFKVIHGEGCDKFDPRTGLCTIYDDRPPVCVVFLRTAADILALSRCGYEFVEMK